MNTNPNLYTVIIPGKFDGYFSGSSLAQGEGKYSNDPVKQTAADVLYEAYQSRTKIRSGKGYRLRLARLTVAAVAVLADYASTCIVVNGDEPDHAEIAAARKVLTDCNAIIYGGWE